MKRHLFFLIIILWSINIIAQTNHTGTITADETWLAAGNPHICTGNVTISSTSHPTLTIEPGVIVKFNPGVTLKIGNATNANYIGGLIAVGTEIDPIMFTSNSANPAHGDWDYIYFQNHCIDANCRIENAVIEYGGLVSPYALYIYNTPAVINNVTFQNNTGSGIKLNNFATGTQRPEITNCTFTGNTDYPIQVYANDIIAFGEGNTFSGNGTDEIYIYGETITSNQDWLNQGIPYYISSDLNLYANGGVTLNIQFGAVLKFNAGKDFTVGNVSNTSYWGTLNATGVEFSGSVDIPGHWFGFIFNNYSEGGVLSGCTIKNAGSTGTTPRSVYITTSINWTQQTITGCQIIDGLGDGLYLGNDCRPTLSGNTISNHTEYPLSIYANDVGWIGPNNSFSGNGIDVIEVRSGTITDSQIWENHEIPFLLTNAISVSGTLFPHLQIMPGCIIQLKQGDYIQTGSLSNASYQGSLESEGVTFTRASIGEIHRGLYFAKYSVDANCTLTDCIIEYGGDNDIYNAGITINQSAPTLNHVTFRNNDGFGLRINDITEGDSLPEVRNCRFYDNAEQPIRIYASELSCLKEDNIYSGNSPDRIYVSGDGINFDTEWINQGIPFEIYNNVILSSVNHPHLIINSGITLMFDAGHYINIGSSSNPSYTGSIEANGVIFTGMTNTPGDWGGLRFYRYCDSNLTELDKCKIEYATTNILCSNSSPLIKQCVITNASNYGIQATSSLAIPNIFKCSIYNNDVGIYCNSGGNPTIGGDTGNANSITDNITYGVQNTNTTVTVNATYNWWGDETGPYHSSNSAGLGNPVSDYVDFANFLTTSLAEAPSLFDLLSPVSGETINSFDSVLDWETSIDPTPNDVVKYRLELSTTADYQPGFTTIVDDIEGSQFLLSNNEIDDDTRYWWRVTAYDLSGFETNSSQQNWYFDVFVADPPDYFTLISPDNQETVFETSVLLSWNAATDPDPGDSVFYTVYLDETASFTQPDTVVTNETGVYTPFCTPANIFYWTVKATDTYGKSTYSDVRSFYVDSSARPRAPRLLNITKNGNNFDLDWEEVPGTDSYDIEQSIEPHSGFSYLDSSAINSYSHINAALNFSQSFYRIKAIDDELIRFWRDLSENRISRKQIH